MMSVYTPVTTDELAAWLTRYALGAVHGFEPIAEGIENTNYFLTADRGRYVLTLYERLPPEELPFYLNLMAHLARAGVMAPAPEPDRTGALWSFLNGKPAGLVARLDGSPVDAPDASHCAAVGTTLAELHLAAKQYRGRLTNRRGPAWWRQAARAVRPLLSAEQNALVAGELKYQACSWPGASPASSTSVSRRPTRWPTTSRSRSTTGAFSRTQNPRERSTRSGFARSSAPMPRCTHTPF